MRRVVIVGTPGSGKTTLASALADKLDLTHIELDNLFHQPGWTQSPPEEFQARVHTAMDDADTRTNGWTMCGNYRSAANRINQDAADTIIWLDMPRWMIMSRVIRRTVRRAVTREELWNGNREPLTNFYRWDPEQNIIRWAWVKFPEYRHQNQLAMADGTWAHATIHHLRSPAEVQQFIANL